MERIASFTVDHDKLQPGDIVPPGPYLLHQPADHLPLLRAVILGKDLLHQLQRRKAVLPLHLPDLPHFFSPFFFRVILSPNRGFCKPHRRPAARRKGKKRGGYPAPFLVFLHL